MSITRQSRSNTARSKRPSMRRSSLPVDTSRNRPKFGTLETPFGSVAMNIVWPFGEKATLVTQLSGKRSRRTSRPVAMSQSRASFSQAASNSAPAEHLPACITASPVRRFDLERPKTKLKGLLGADKTTTWPGQEAVPVWYSQDFPRASGWRTIVVDGSRRQQVYRPSARFDWS